MLRPCYVATTSVVVATLLLAAPPASALDIVIDYTFDSNGFFNNPAARTAIEAAAQRYSDVITTSLGAAEINDVNDGRIGFFDPSGGGSIMLSGATSAATDRLAVAGENVIYGARTFAADTLTIFAGAQDLGGAGQGGTGTGRNFTSVFEDDNSHLNRGFRAPGTSELGNLPVWGGAVSFDINQNWHFGIETAATSTNELDFYSIALHEVGHVLGLNLMFDDFTRHIGGPNNDEFFGANAVEAANADNGTSLVEIDLVSADNTHFADNGGFGTPADPGAIQSFIFSGGNPNLAGTVGLEQLQDLLLEPIANRTFSISRFELTNIDVGALEDIGWTVVEPVTSIPGDFNGDLLVTAADYAAFRDTVGTPAAVGTFADFVANFDATSTSAVASSIAIPEPATLALVIVGLGFLGPRFAGRRRSC